MYVYFTDFLHQESKAVAAEVVALLMRHAVKEQALGEAMLPDRVETLMRCETHLDRRLEKKLAMLMKLQELRRARSADGSRPGSNARSPRRG